MDLSYNFKRGYGVYKGKWLWANSELFARFNISMDFSIRGYRDKADCMAAREAELQSHVDYEKNVMHKDNRFRSFLFQAKRRILVKIRIFLSKIKRFFIRKKKDGNT